MFKKKKQSNHRNSLEDRIRTVEATINAATLQLTPLQDELALFLQQVGMNQ